MALRQGFGQGEVFGQGAGVQALGEHHAQGVLPFGGGVDVLPKLWGFGGLGVRPKVVIGFALRQELRKCLLLRLYGDVLLLEALVLV